MTTEAHIKTALRLQSDAGGFPGFKVRLSVERIRQVLVLTDASLLACLMPGSGPARFARHSHRNIIDYVPAGKSPAEAQHHAYRKVIPAGFRSICSNVSQASPLDHIAAPGCRLMAS